MTTIYMPSGTYFDLADPIPDKVFIADIAHNLAHLCRFNGSTERFYSVAQHSIHVSELVPEQYKLAALLHDAAEAYTGDITSPMKQLLGPTYRNIYDKIELAICLRFGVTPSFVASGVVKSADLTMMATECEQMLPHAGLKWDILVGYDPLPSKLPLWSPEQVRYEFMQRFMALTGNCVMEGV